MKKSLLLLFLLFTGRLLIAQIPAELVVGHQFYTGDVLFFKQFKPDSPWLFFHRDRFSADYVGKTSYGITNIISYNLKSGIGLAGATVITAAGVTPRAGLQVYLRQGNVSVFGLAWVGRLRKVTDYAYFSIVRWQPPLNKQWKLFSQMEVIGSFTKNGHAYSLQRGRLGLSYGKIQFGAAGDLREDGTKWLLTQNFGAFLRREF